MKVKISQIYALMIEQLRSLGWSDEELIRRAKAKDLPADDSMFEFDFQELGAFAEQEPETFEAAVREGYRMKFNTMGGIRCWLLIVYGKDPELNREPGQESITVALTLEEKERLEEALSVGWVIAGEHQGRPEESSVYRIELEHRGVI